jgi:osmoprotectant transport system ATP-binding protein
MGDVNQHAVAFRDASYRIADQTILDGVRLEVPTGETMVLLGRSGSGKTTALRLVNGLLTPSAGEVWVRGLATTSWDPVRLRRETGYVIQEVGLFPHMTVSRNVGLVPELDGAHPDAIRARVSELLRLVGLDPGAFGSRRPAQLSGGQRQRVGVARALAADPPLLLCDEPFGAVDPITRVDLQREFQDLTRRLGKTVIFVTHDVREALLLADRITVLEAGRLVFVDTPDAFRASTDPLIRRLRELVA